MENRKWEIRYKTAIYHKSIEFQGTYFEAIERYSKIKWDNKVLWDITTIPELIKSSDGSGSGNEYLSLSELVKTIL